MGPSVEWAQQPEPGGGHPVRGGATKMTNRHTSWMKRETRSRRCKDSRDVASAVKKLKAPAQATSLESLHRRLLVPSEPSESASESASSHLPVQDDRCPVAADVHFNADKQKTKSDTHFICHLSVLTALNCQFYDSLFVFCSSAL